MVSSEFETGLKIEKSSGDGVNPKRIMPQLVPAFAGVHVLQHPQFMVGALQDLQLMMRQDEMGTIPDR